MQWVWISCHTNTVSCAHSRCWKAGRCFLTLTFFPLLVFIDSHFIFRFPIIGISILWIVSMVQSLTTNEVKRYASSLCSCLHGQHCFILLCRHPHLLMKCGAQSPGPDYHSLLRLLPQQPIYLFCICIGEERTRDGCHSSLTKLSLLPNSAPFTNVYTVRCIEQMCVYCLICLLPNSF